MPQTNEEPPSTSGTPPGSGDSRDTRRATLAAALGMAAFVASLLPLPGRGVVVFGCGVPAVLLGFKTRHGARHGLANTGVMLGGLAVAIQVLFALLVGLTLIRG